MTKGKWFGAGLLIMALLAAGLSTVVLLRAGETRERIDGNLQKAAELLREADTAKGTDPGRSDELTQEAARYTGFAEADQGEYDSRSMGGWLFAAGAAGCLAGGLVLMLVPGRRESRSPRYGHA
ncbi:hypothetical protein [Streptosporangium sp. NPDC051022]|uniref:hypothetical protein n=1 Tax=Streptosporangium sp. NPDC051022 TaxID=3155752 RepID=UPI0034446AFB